MSGMWHIEDYIQPFFSFSFPFHLHFYATYRRTCPPPFLHVDKLKRKLEDTALPVFPSLCAPVIAFSLHCFKSCIQLLIIAKWSESITFNCLMHKAPLNAKVVSLVGSGGVGLWLKFVNLPQFRRSETD